MQENRYSKLGTDTRSSEFFGTDKTAMNLEIYFQYKEIILLQELIKYKYIKKVTTWRQNYNYFNKIPKGEFWSSGVWHRVGGLISVFVKDPSTFVNKVQTLVEFENLKSPIYTIVPTLKMGLVCSTEALVPTYQIVVCYVTQNTSTWVTSCNTIRLDVHSIATKPAIRRHSHRPPSTYRYANRLGPTHRN